MTTPVATNIGSTVQNTNGTNFKILENARAGSNPPFVVEDITTGEIQYFYGDGVAYTFGQANLVLSINGIPPNDVNPNLKLNTGMICQTRNGEQVRIDRVTSQDHFQVFNTNGFDIFGYEVWISGMKLNSGTDPNDIVDLWNDPTQLSYWVLVDTQDPADQQKWSTLITSNNRPQLSTVPAGKRLMFLGLREPTSDTQKFKLDTY